MKKFLLLGALAMLFSSCASDTQTDIEQARFYLDQGEFAKAKALSESILETQPANQEAKFIVASSLVGNFALAQKSGCQATDTGYLGTLACLLDDSGSDDSTGFKTFGRIAAQNTDNNDDIFKAVGLLEGITKFSATLSEKDVALQRLVARSFQVSTYFQTVKANSANTECNAGGAGVDDVPDDYNEFLLSSRDANRFIQDMNGIQADCLIVGFDGSFNLIKRTKRILTRLNTLGGTNLQAVRALFNESYNSTAQQVCN